jgi:hypothetical protein
MGCTRFLGILSGLNFLSVFGRGEPNEDDFVRGTLTIEVDPR